MDIDISQKLKELFYSYFRNSSNLVCKNSDLARSFKQKCFEILLTRTDCETSDVDLNWGSSYDQFYAFIFTAKLKAKDRERLNFLIDALREKDSSELRNALRFLLNLSNVSDKSESSCENGMKLTCSWIEEPDYEYSKYNLRRTINWCEMPQLHVDNAERERPRFNYYLPQLYESDVFSKQCLRSQSDKLEIPELSDDLGDQKYRIPRLSLKTYSPYLELKSKAFESGMKLDVDEGFEETVTPSSGISFKQNSLDFESLIDVASREDFYSVYEKHPRSWETQRCKDPPLERALLTEAGPEAVNQLIRCYMSDLSLIAPDQVDHFRRESVLINVEYAVKCILYVLIAIPSNIFAYDKTCRNFVETPVVLSGLSPTAFCNILKEFALSGTYYRRLEEAIEFVHSTEHGSLVLKALTEGIRRYLFHVRYLITDMLGRCKAYEGNKFFQLRDETISLRMMTFSIAKLLNISEDWELGCLPSGFELLQKIYKTVVDSHFNPVFISLFRWSLQPYFIFLQDWAFEGRNCDQYSEFPLKPNMELYCIVRDEKWWSEGYNLKMVDDHILGSQLLSQVFVCGKTLLVLRHCCPLHPLFSQTCKRPRFNIGLTESSIEKIESEWKVYFKEIDFQLSKHQHSTFEIPLSNESPARKDNVKTVISPDLDNLTTVIECSKEPVYQVSPYSSELPLFSDSVVDVARCAIKKIIIDNEPLHFNGWVLRALVERCVMQPLRTQASLVNRVALQYVLNEVKLKKHFEFFANHFFMQDGEFSQSLCDLLFAHLMSIDRPTQLLNRMTLISILDEACAQSIGRNDACLTEFRAKLSFSVRYVPHKFKKHSVTVLECIRLTKPVEWPMSIVITSDAHKHYQFIFNFLLQLRLCLWSLSDIFYILKTNDPFSSSSPKECSVKTVQRYRLVQFYRQSMLHFIKSVHEHLNLMAFQKSIMKFKEDIRHVKSIDDLILSHNAYLKKVAFRCLLTKVAAPLMKILKDVFSCVLEFRWRLIRNVETSLGERWEDDEKFDQLTNTHEEFKKHSSLLAKAAVKMAPEGYQPHFANFLTRLQDCEVDA